MSRTVSDPDARQIAGRTRNTAGKTGDLPATQASGSDETPAGKETAQTKSSSYRRMRALERILRRYTDDDHSLTREELTARLKAEKIEVRRNTFHSDMLALQAALNQDELVIGQKGKENSYFIRGAYLLDYYQAKILHSLVHGSDSVSEAKAGALDDALKTLCHSFEWEMLEKASLVFNSRKRSNGGASIAIANADIAIAQGKSLKFTYVDDYYHDAKGKPHTVPHPHHPVKCVEPYVHVVKDGISYLLAWDPDCGERRTYRFDRMTGSEVVDAPRSAEALAHAPQDLPAEMTSAFHMFSDEDTRALTFEFPTCLMGAIHDTFGETIPLQDCGHGRWRITAEIQLSGQFYGWLAGFQGKIRIVGAEKETAAIADSITALDRLLRGEGNI